MATFTSNFKELAFFVGSTPHKFKGGKYTTEDKAVIEAISKLKGVKKVDEPKTTKAASEKAATKEDKKEAADKPKKTSQKKKAPAKE